MPRARAEIDPLALTSAFAGDGMHATTSDELARRAHVAKPTLYVHGGSKEALFQACVEAEVKQLLDIMAAADTAARQLPARGRLIALALAIIEHGQRHPDAARLLHHTARHRSSGVAASVDAALARLPAQIATILRQVTTPGAADRIAPAFLGATAAIAAVPRLRAGVRRREAELIGEAFAAALEPPET